MSNVYSNLTGEFKHPLTGKILFGNASMVAQVHAKGGLRKIQEESYLDGYRDGIEEAENLKNEVRKCVAEALREMGISSPKV